MSGHGGGGGGGHAKKKHGKGHGPDDTELETRLASQYESYVKIDKDVGQKYDSASLSTAKTDKLAKAWHTLSSAEFDEDRNDLIIDSQRLLHNKVKNEYVKNVLKGKKNLSHLSAKERKAEAEKFADYMLKTAMRAQYIIAGKDPTEAQSLVDTVLAEERTRGFWENMIFGQFRGGRKGFVLEVMEKTKNPDYSLRNMKHTTEWYQKIAPYLDPHAEKKEKLGEEINSNERNKDMLRHSEKMFTKYDIKGLKFHDHIAGTQALDLVQSRMEDERGFQKTLYTNRDYFAEIDKDYIKTPYKVEEKAKKPAAKAHDAPAAGHGGGSHATH